MKHQKLLVNLGVLTLSAACGVLLCEVASRALLHPADYLSVQMVPDPLLGAVPSTGTKAGGFDPWGFRNRQVPKTADIVAIGDSHTYGNTATMDDSWPKVLARLARRDVYNMGLGGYGPNQYFELLKTRALSLKPRLIIVGLYMGDDFENAFVITYGLDHWAYLRELAPGTVNNFSPDIWDFAPPNPGWHKRIRLWLSRHSVVYQLLFHASLLGRLQGNVQIDNATRLSDSATSLSLPEKHISEAFVPKGFLRSLDQDSQSVREGMRITFRLLEEMKEICRQNQVQFLVVVIPTKEMVFSEYLEHNSKVHLGEVVDQLLANERLARQRTFAFLEGSGIATVDTLPALKASVGHELYTRSAGDMHPSRNGYRVIAEAIVAALQKGEAKR
jgi:hypothetical protein